MRRTPATGQANSRTDWDVLAASSPGASHRDRTGPNQDAERHLVGERTTIVAVSDGHGHHRHFRSHVGAAMAVEAAVAAGAAWAAEMGGGRPPGVVVESLRSDLVPAVVEAWRTAVGAHVAANPLPPADPLDDGRPGGSREVAYGATLLLAVAAPGMLALAQIGDGDIVTVAPDGTSSCPVPPDPILDGRQTTSLSQPDAVASFRVAAVDLAATPVGLVLVATDGYGNAQSADPWAPLVGADLCRMIAEQGVEWVAANLPVWVARCASGEGSGDDTTVALMVADEFVRTAGETRGI